MAKYSFLDTNITRAIALLLAGGTVSFGLSISLILYVWNEAQASAETTRKTVDRHSEEISELKSSQAVVITKLENIATKIDDFRAYFHRELERNRADR